MTAAKARALLAEAQALLLDFDGPVCNVFEGFPAYRVADQLRDLLAQGGHEALPDDVRNSPDPFDVFRYAAKVGQDAADHVEAAFRAHEVEAVQLAKPTPGAHELVRAWKSTGRPLAIVSNNSAAAVKTYLARFDLVDLVDCVSARALSNPTLLKPAPHFIENALHWLRVSPAGAVMLGDSIADIESARVAGTRSIGYANKSGKSAEFKRAGAEAVLVDMSSLLCGYDESIESD